MGKGTEFTVALECEIAGEAVKQEPVPEQEELIKCENQKPHAESKRNYKGKKALLVEDNELNREIATAIIKEIGLDVDIARGWHGCCEYDVICRRQKIRSDFHGYSDAEDGWIYCKPGDSLRWMIQNAQIYRSLQ